MKKLLALLSLFVGISLLYTQAQEAELPSWVLFGMAKRAVEERNYPQAIRHFRSAIEKRGKFPEAERELALVMGLGGDPTIQRKTLERALSQAQVLEVPNDKILILYDLARMDATGPESGLIAGQNRLTESLTRILEQDLVWLDSREPDGRNPMSTVWRGFLNYEQNETPLDRLLYLFGQRSDLTIEAHQMMATLKTRGKKGQWDLASEHLIFASLYLVSRLRDEFQVLEPGLENPGLRVIFDSEYLGGASSSVPKEERYVLKKYEPLMMYLEENRFWETLFKLGEALWERGPLNWDARPPIHTAKEAAKSIWSFINLYGPPENLWVRQAGVKAK